MEYQVIIEDFQGPLDLLLHLIKEKEMDLEKLELSLIADQYLQYIHAMDPSKLEIMSEYLVMAADLIEMKSKMLIPKEKVTINDEYQEDPREALIKRLIEYKRYKDVLDEIRDKYEQRQTVIIKPAESMDEYVVDTHIAKKDISIDERTAQIRNYFKTRVNKKVKFEELFDRHDRFYFIVTFISILVLAKDKEVEIIQDGLFEEIYVEGKV